MLVWSRAAFVLWCLGCTRAQQPRVQTTTPFENTLKKTTPPTQKCETMMDAFCNGPTLSRCIDVIRANHGELPLVPLFDTGSRLEASAWRCYSGSALTTPNHITYNRTAPRSSLYCTEPELSIVFDECTGTPVPPTPPPPPPPPPTKLVMLTDAAEKLGAVCLDGSAPAIYVRRGDPTKWHVHFEGGGWCYHDPPGLLEDNECFYRAYGPSIESNTPPHYLGSSAMLPANYSAQPPRPFQHFLSADPAANPGMHNWSFAFVHYCDGASFTGDLAEPVTVQGKPLYYRGRRIRDAAIRYLLDAGAGEGMSLATDVAVSGTSAGGLAIYLNIDAIRGLIPSQIHVRGLASAGHFLDYGTTFPPQMLHLAFEQNSTGAFYQACINDVVAKGGPAEVCIFPEYFSRYIQTPVFALQSRFDTWQLEHIPHISSRNESGAEAYGKVIESRMAPLIAAANTTTARSAATPEQGEVAAPPHAVWLSACLTHGLAQTSHWTVAEIDGVHEWEAFQRWFNGSLDLQRRNWIDCTTYNCQRTCP